MRYSVPSVRAVQNGQELFLFFVPAKTLKALPIRVEKFDANKSYDDPDQGYQRTAENNRARRFARYLSEPGATSPTAIMLNDRNRQTTYDASKGELIFDSEKGPIFNYDGQHRQLGYQFRLEGDESFADFPIPVVMTRGMEKLTEMLQFRIINSTAKGVATGLVNAILANLHSKEGDDAIDPSEYRNVVCYKVSETLTNDPLSPWHNLIALPNQSQWGKNAILADPTLEHTRVIKANSFIDSLRPVYDHITTLNLAASLDSRAEEIGSVLNEFWSAVKDQMPEIFECPNDYTLLKSNGVGAMNLVLRDFLIKMFAARRKFLKTEFLAMMEGSNLLTDPGFWRSDNEDGARNYSGKAGWPDLAKRIIRDLDEGRADTNLFATGNPGQSPVATPGSHFSQENRKTAPKPEATMCLQIRGVSTPITRFNQIPVIVANWIFRQRGNLVIIPNFVHSANEGFPRAAQTRELENGYFIEIGDDRKRLFQKGRILLDRNDMPDVTFTVVLEDGTTASY